MSDRDACHVEPAAKQATPAEQSQVDRVVLAVGGMGCPNCAARVRNSLLKVYGVVEADVLHPHGVAQVFFNPTLTQVDQLIEAVSRAGGDGRHEYRAQRLAPMRP